MKPKISPTSPKNTVDQESQIDSLYKEHLQTIQKPNTRKTGTPLWLLLLVVVIGFASGIIGLIALLAYGSDIAVLNKLPFFSSGLPQTIITTGRSMNGLASTDIQKTVDTLSASVVSIYETQTASDGLSAYTSDHLRGNGFILTDDGYIATTQAIVGDVRDITVITQSGDIYIVESVINDPGTQFTFLKIKATGLSSVGISTVDEVPVLSEAVIIKQIIYKTTPVVGVGTIAAIEQDANVLDTLTATSSENMDQGLLFSEKLSSVLDSGVVFTPGGKVIGMLLEKDNNASIVPFADVADIITQVVGGQHIVRPYLGVHYIDLAITPGLPESVSQGLSQGALIYSDDEQARPSVVVGSPAQTAHLKKGDVITTIDDQVIDGSHRLARIILEHKPGDSITAKVLRNKSELSLTIIVGEHKD